MGLRPLGSSDVVISPVSISLLKRRNLHRIWDLLALKVFGDGSAEGTARRVLGDQGVNSSAPSPGRGRTPPSRCSENRRPRRPAKRYVCWDVTGNQAVPIHRLSGGGLWGTAVVAADCQFGLEITMAKSHLRVGTSGWVYPHWRGGFYPAKLPQKDWFKFYASQFDTAEINATFYRLPSHTAVAAWREAAPQGFQFAWKASRYITQAKKLRDAEAPLARVYAPMAALGPASGPALFQLPPQLRLDLQRLSTFLRQLPLRGRQAIEFRHASWYDDRVFDLLAAHDVALCVSDHHDAPAPWVRTGSFVYIRGHGPDGTYAGSYGAAELSRWARHVRNWRAEDRDVYAYFDNDIGCAAPGDARDFRALASDEAAV